MRLKIKLVIAISLMVVAIVLTLSTIYVAQLVHHVISDGVDNGEYAANQIVHFTRDAIDRDLKDLNTTKIDPADQKQINDFIVESLQMDGGLNDLLESQIGYSKIISDATVVGPDGRAILHSDFLQVGKPVPDRPSLGELEHAKFWRQLQVVYGPIKTYAIKIPLERNNQPFGSAQVGISSVFIQTTLQKPLNRALTFSAIAILVSLVLAATLSSFALRPLAAISRRLDQMSAGEITSPPPTELNRADEYGNVSSKIERIGRQMRTVNEVFAALQENVDQIMANLQDGLMLFTQDQRAVLVSASIETFLGKPRSEMLGSYAEQIFSRHTQVGRSVLNAFAGHEPMNMVELTGDNGTEVQVSLDFIEEGGQQLGALLTMRDMESMRKIEGEIEVSRRMANIGKLTSGVAHEVKNPINSIVVHLEILRNKLNQPDADTERHMDVIETEIQRLDRVVQTLVDFTRPVELRLSETDLRTLVEQVAFVAKPDCERQGVHLVTEITSEPLMAKVDTDLMKQGLLNIIINAAQAMENGGTLTLRALRSDDEAQLEIQDTGPGIPPAIRDKVFNLYFTTKKSGSGIGLAMTYRILQLHNGSIHFDTRSGEGTTFYLNLPLVRTEQGQQRDLVAQS
ncbi:MAG: PAS domain-containing sensor histidine kinase [Acidobacteria bacterium]|nr:MAG: PAS domain-containing sensor histidine kinase [Acidobacteriota bacterium]